MNSFTIRVVLTFVLILSFKFNAISQNNIEDSEYIKISLEFNDNVFTCENPGCKNSYTSLVPVKLLSIKKGISEEVLAVLMVMSYNSIASANYAKSNTCNNYNFRKCNYKAKTDKLVDELVLSKSKFENETLLSAAIVAKSESTIKAYAGALFTEFIESNSVEAKKFLKQESENIKEKARLKQVEEKEREDAKLRVKSLKDEYQSLLISKDFKTADSLLNSMYREGIFKDKNDELNILLLQWANAFEIELQNYMKVDNLDQILSLKEIFENRKLTSNYSDLAKKDKELKLILANSTSVISKHKELKQKALTPLESLFVGKWEFESKSIFMKNGNILIMYETWIVNPDRTYVYQSKYKEWLGKEYFGIYDEEGMYEITIEGIGDLYLTAYINKENRKTSYRIDKMKFDEISKKKASRTIYMDGAKAPFVIKGKKVK